MEALLEAFKKHWVIQGLGICSVVAAATWGLAVIYLEPPLKIKVDNAEHEARQLRDQLSQLRDYLSMMKDQMQIARQTQAVAAPEPKAISVPSTTPSGEDPGIASGACRVLEEGNQFYTHGKHDEAVRKYLTVQGIDRLGRSGCVGAIYATIGTIYTMRGQSQFSSDPAGAAKSYRLANEYNRAFAAAAICNRGDCQLAERYWEHDPFANL